MATDEERGTVLASAAERQRCDEVMARVLDAIRSDQKIKLPPFDPNRSESADFALQSIEHNDFSGSMGPFRYQFEGEDDLLHLMVVRANSAPITVEEGRQVASFLLPDVPPALIWLKPGEFSQHFYLGHDELLYP